MPIGKSAFDSVAGLALAMAVGGLVLLFAPAPARAQSDTLIVPGQRVGPVQLGMQPGDVARALGQPSRTLTRPELTYEYRDRFSIVFSGIPEREVVLVNILDPRFATREGIRVGSSGVDVVRAYGRNYIKSDHPGVGADICYSDIGLKFFIGPRNDVQTVILRLPGTC